MEPDYRNELIELEKLKFKKPNELATILVNQRQSPLIEQLFGRLPDLSIQARFTGLTKSQTFIQAITFLKLCEQIALDNKNPFSRNKNGFILDFGSGWGRITQLLSLFFNPTKIIGCDIQKSAIEIAKSNGIRASFLVSEQWPPSDFSDESVEFIFSYSVFSHLSEENSFAWIREFERILKPGGIAFLTTRDRSFFYYIESLQKMDDVPSFAAGTKNSFLSIEESIIKYDKGQFCFDGNGAEEFSPHYGEAFIPPNYVNNVYSKIFYKVGFENPKPMYLLDQATIWLIKDGASLKYLDKFGPQNPSS